METSQSEQPREERGRLAFRRNWISYVALVLAFGVVVPRLKGLEFFDPQLMSAYACIGMIFSGPAAAQAFRNKPRSLAEANKWIFQSVLFGEIIAAAMLVCGVATVYLTHLHSVFFLPDLLQLATSEALGLTGSVALAALAAWLTLQFSEGVARMGLLPGSPVNWRIDLFLKIRIADQMKLVRKPPQRTTTRIGRFCQRSRRWWARSSRLAMAPMGAPDLRPKAKQELMMPAKMATARPLPKL